MYVGKAGLERTCCCADNAINQNGLSVRKLYGLNDEKAVAQIDRNAFMNDRRGNGSGTCIACTWLQQPGREVRMKYHIIGICLAG